eukprot:607349-Ditylum_brightwellii.AAC.1
MVKEQNNPTVSTHITVLLLCPVPVVLGPSRIQCDIWRVPFWLHIRKLCAFHVETACNLTNPIPGLSADKTTADL